MQTVGRREPLHGELGRFYDAIENPRRDTRRAADPARRRASLLPRRGARARAGGPRRVGARVRRGPAAGRRLRLRDADRPRAPAQRDHAPADPDWSRATSRWRSSRPPSRTPRGRRWSWSRAGRRRSAPAPAASPTTTSARATPSSWSPFWIDRTPVTNRAYAEFVADTGAEPPMYWEPDADGWWIAHGDGPRRARSTPTSRWSTSPGTRPTRSPAGPASGCRPSRSGRRPPGRRPGARQPRPARLRLRRGGRLRRRALGLRGGADARRRLGVDLLRLRRPTRASAPSPIASTPRSSSATPTRCCAAAPGRPAAT